jgi:hypothetical protein
LVAEAEHVSQSVVVALPVAREAVRRLLAVALLLTVELQSVQFVVEASPAL